MKWLTPMAVIGFCTLFWQFDHWFHQMARIGSNDEQSSADEASSKAGERPLDRFMGLATLIVLLPVLFGGFLRPLWMLIVLYCIWPGIAMVLLGCWRGRQSVSAILFFVAHGIEMLILSQMNRFLGLSNTGSLAYRAEMARFWLDKWFTVSLAFCTLFGATLVVIYIVKPSDYGWPALAKERQVLALLYSVAALWMVVASFIWWGLPALRLTLSLPGVNR